ncbi:hypothetical protein LOK49_LG01G03438 [Camellia lanceoleosa]|uniref:Uncharacterized protein n=1 Tax=Camellia lanceoleosa TaxID=1840588 RepID=A0ACC0J441_9ERIC|nr:hypothetical protein LOK49_LG01G03438 [Camellia lanceoleosa]
MEKRDPRTAVAIILGGGAGIRLFPLTKSNAKPAVPIGGSYRLIDVPMSNCINSGINKVYILTQFNSASLNRHLTRTYNFAAGVTFGDGYVKVSTQTPDKEVKRWFQGIADAVRQFHWLFEDERSKDTEDVVILSGDHLYRMGYMDFNHRQSGADITLSCLPMDYREKKLESKNVAVEKWWRSLLKPSKKSFIGQCQKNMKEGNIRGGKRRLEIILAIEYKKSPEVQEANLSSPPPPEPEPIKVEAPVTGPLDLLGLNDPVPGASKLDKKNALALAIVPIGKLLWMCSAGAAAGKLLWMCSVGAACSRVVVLSVSTWLFPVKLPDYHEIIERPMDFRTVRKKLEEGCHSNLDEF